MFAQTMVGHIDGADICFLVAFILACVVLVIRAMANPRPVDGVLIAAWAALMALAFWII